MNRSFGSTVRLLGGAAILGCLVWRLGTGPFLDGRRRSDRPAVRTPVAAGGPARG